MTANRSKLSYTGRKLSSTTQAGDAQFDATDFSVVDGVVSLSDTATITSPTLTSPVINTSVSGTAILDEDAMTSNSATKLATQQSIKAYVDSGTVTMTNKTLTSPVLNTGVSGTAVLDEDDMSTNSATQIATQQSIKAYVDSGTVTFTNKTIDADGTGNAISNINADELDPVAAPSAGDGSDSVYNLPFLIQANMSNLSAAFSIYSSNAPFKFKILDAWSVNKSGDGGTWAIDDGTNTIVAAVTVAANDTDIDRAATIDDAYATIAASGSLRIVPDGGGALDADVYIMAVRVN